MHNRFPYFHSPITNKTYFKMKKQLLSIFVSFIIAEVSFAQMDTVFYHTSQFTSQYGTGGGQPTVDFYKYATRFTPSIPYPCKLVKMKAWFRNCLKDRKSVV